VLYWLSTLPLPDPLPGVDIVHIQIPDFTDYIKDINRKFLHLMPQVVATDFNRLPRYIGIKIALYDTRRQGRARACARVRSGCRRKMGCARASLPARIGSLLAAKEFSAERSWIGVVYG